MYLSWRSEVGYQIEADESRAAALSLSTRGSYVSNYICSRVRLYEEAALPCDAAPLATLDELECLFLTGPLAK